VRGRVVSLAVCHAWFCVVVLYRLSTSFLQHAVEDVLFSARARSALTSFYQDRHYQVMLTCTMRRTTAGSGFSMALDKLGKIWQLRLCLRAWFFSQEAGQKV
jgi:hypothetical protein